MKATPYKLCVFMSAFFLFSVNISHTQQLRQDVPGLSMCRIRMGNSDAATRNAYSFSDLAANAITHVVYISTVRLVKRSPLYDDPAMRRFFGPDFNPQTPPAQIENSLGSGVFISEDGYVVTSNHVVEGAGQIKVTCNGSNEYDAEIVGADPSTDLAVIRLKGDFSALTPVTFGNSDSVRAGDVVLAIGSPFGLNRSVSMGVISAKDRANFGVVEYEDFLQTDASINPGNSGGALVNMCGELIGINAAILSGSGGSEGVGFSVPSNMVRDVVEEILKNGRVVRGDLGIGTQQIDQDMIDAFRLQSATGVIVTEVENGGPGGISGLKRGDVILRVGDTDIKSRSEFRNIVAFTAPGEKLRLSVLRDGDTLSFETVVREDPPKNGKKGTGGEWDLKPGGLSVAELSQDVRRQFQIPESVTGAVIVAQVEPGTAAELAGFTPGEVILEVNRAAVTSLADFTRMYDEAKGESILFLIQRREGNFYRYLRSQ